MAYRLQAKSGKPYSKERNYTIIVGLEADFRDLVKGKAQEPAAVEPVPRLQGGAAKIDVISDSVPSTQQEALAPVLQQMPAAAKLERRKPVVQSSQKD